MKALPAPARLSEARFTRMAKLDPLEHAYWVGWDASKLQKETCTSMHIFPQSSTIPTRPYHIPTHPSTSLHKPTTAVADAQTIVRMGLTNWHQCPCTPKVHQFLDSTEYRSPGNTADC